MMGLDESGNGILQGVPKNFYKVENNCYTAVVHFPPLLKKRHHFAFNVMSTVNNCHKSVLPT
jgi:hypothetical protein